MTNFIPISIFLNFNSNNTTKLLIKFAEFKGMVELFAEKKGITYYNCVG